MKGRCELRVASCELEETEEFCELRVTSFQVQNLPQVPSSAGTLL